MNIKNNETNAERKTLRLSPLAKSRMPGRIELGSDFTLSPVIAGAITIALLVLSAYGAWYLKLITNDQRPFTLLFLVPAVFGAAFFGVRGGMFTALIALIIARLFLFPNSGNQVLANSVSGNVELVALAFGTITIAFVAGRLRSVLSELRQANNDLIDSERRRRNFSSEVLLAVTGGVLRLSTDDAIRGMLDRDPDRTMKLCEPDDAAVLRHIIVDDIKNRGIETVRLDDLSTVATEAASNAIKHGNGGSAAIWYSSHQVSILIEDTGTGISPAQLARATLERGFSTRVSLGMGFFMMIESVDSIVLSTSPKGTSLLLTVGGSKKSTIEDSIMSHY
jgi:anti-sigma regulatory factor (Ser/Thr protein kinase)